MYLETENDSFPHSDTQANKWLLHRNKNKGTKNNDTNLHVNDIKVMDQVLQVMDQVLSEEHHDALGGRNQEHS